MPLIKQICEAVEAGQLVQPFTTQDLKKWMKKMHIVKDNGAEYAASSIDAILSNSNKKNTPTSNLNIKVLQSRRNKEGNNEYYF